MWIHFSKKHGRRIRESSFYEHNLYHWSEIYKTVLSSDLGNVADSINNMLRFYLYFSD